VSTGIAWTNETWNPLAGCSHASPGCDGCYAARDAYGRLSHLPTYQGLAIKRTPDELPRFTGEIRLLPERLDQPLRWKRPRMIFVNSMSDLFHPDVPAPFIAQVFAVMAAASQHTFQVLTKRPHRMARLMADVQMKDLVDGLMGQHAHAGAIWPPPNVWLGTSIENDAYAWRAKHLLSTRAVVRFLSLEPLIGPVPSLDFHGIDWVIIGGESGPRSRVMQHAWAHDIIERAHEAGAAVFVKQLGVAWRRYHQDPTTWPPGLRVREWPAGFSPAST
jgi:protein gp37